MEKADITRAQRLDPVLTVVLEQLRKGTPPPNPHNWMKFPLRHYKQMWSQLVLHDSILCRKVKSPIMAEDRLLIVVPHSQQKLFLTFTTILGIKALTGRWQDCLRGFTGLAWGVMWQSLRTLCKVPNCQSTKKQASTFATSDSLQTLGNGCS